MHILGPQPNGKNDAWPFVAFEMPSENLSRLNCFASHPTVHNHGGLGLSVEQSPLQLVLSNFPTWFPCELFEVAKLLVGTTSEPHSVSWLPMSWITNYYQSAFFREFSKIK